MSRLHLRRQHAERPADGTEDQEVRQYRFLLRTAPADTLEAAHCEALGTLGQDDRAALLQTVQRTLVAGQRLTTADHGRIAHLMTLGERRSPGILLSAYPPPSLKALAHQVIHTQAVFGLFGGYAAWDGLDPEPEDDSAWADGGFNPDSGRWDPARTHSKDWEGAPGGYGGFPDGGGGF